MKCACARDFGLCVCERNEFNSMTLIRNRDKGFRHKLNTMAKKIMPKLNDWLINDLVFIDFANLNSYKLFTVNVCLWRAIKRPTERMNCTNNGKIDWYDSTIWFTDKQKRFFILIETALHDFKFSELRVYCVYTFCLPTLNRSIWPLKQH